MTPWHWAGMGRDKIEILDEALIRCLNYPSIVSV